ncbi:substrate-binding periplasmic protein [Alysiella crassa]|uniref:L-cystine-binding protein tcyA n=1 Tax=Alysiella crassa TaxID=153491 RepID=A0A376BT19_9NEIS|nr:transporter substrate-binding domain-containing protein [Alysiella crassa]SSY80147.1 L-cystine-binding protein tcyA precursor [Alysiella crassa]
MSNYIAKMTLLLGIFALTACEKEQANPNTPPKEVKSVYRVASELSKFPVVMHDTKTNKVEGFEAELLQAVAEKQGFTVEYTIDTWQGLLNKLDNNQADMLLGSITITDERRQKMDFTDPVLPYKTGVMVIPKLAQAKSFSELKGKKVNLRQNTVYEKLTPIFANESGSNMVYPESVWGQVKSLISGESEAMVGASITLEYYKTRYPEHNFHIIYEANSPISHYGWAVKKGDNELVHRLNMGLNKVKQDGTYDRIYQKYWSKQ